MYIEVWFYCTVSGSKGEAIRQKGIPWFLYCKCHIIRLFFRVPYFVLHYISSFSTYENRYEWTLFQDLTATSPAVSGVMV